jgi:hypothetical protein
MTKVGDFYTKFVNVFDQIIDDENEIDRKSELKRWITAAAAAAAAAAKKNETIFVEVDLSSYNNEVEDKLP